MLISLNETKGALLTCECCVRSLNRELFTICAKSDEIHIPLNIERSQHIFFCSLRRCYRTHVRPYGAIAHDLNVDAIYEIKSNVCRRCSCRRATTSCAIIEPPYTNFICGMMRHEPATKTHTQHTYHSYLFLLLNKSNNKAKVYNFEYFSFHTSTY